MKIFTKKTEKQTNEMCTQNLKKKNFEKYCAFDIRFLQ